MVVFNYPNNLSNSSNNSGVKISFSIFIFLTIGNILGVFLSINKFANRSKLST